MNAITSNNNSINAVVNEKLNVILEVAKQIENNEDVDTRLKVNNVKKFYDSNHNWVFKVDKIPGIIFKIPSNTDWNKTSFKNRLKNIESGKSLCEKLSLNFIIIPEIHKINDNTLAEKKIKFIKNQRELYEIYSKETISKALKQFVIFIYETGLADTHKENFKFTADGSGITLYDLEFMNPTTPENGLTTLIYSLPDMEFLAGVKETIKACNPQTYEKMWGKAFPECEQWWTDKKLTGGLI